MEHKEDEQPNESVYARRKRILPFVKNTSRIQGQAKHQFASVLVPIPPSESTRGRGNGRGRGRGRGQGNYKGKGRTNPPPPAPEQPRFKEVNPWAQLDDLREHTPRPTTPEPSIPPHSGVQSSSSSSHPPPENPRLEMTRPEPDEWAPGPSTLGPQPPIRPFQNSKQPRKRFRPGKNGKRYHNNQSHSAATNHPSMKPPVDPQLPEGLVDFRRDEDNYPLAKRPRIKEEASPSRASLSTTTQEKAIKPEIEDDAAIDLLREEPTSGTKFVSYDDHPMCRFNCGELPSQVREHRKKLKRQEVQALRDRGMEVLAAFIRDDGIAIDWAISAKADASTPKSMSPVIILDEPESSAPLLSETTNVPTPPPPPNQPLPSHLNPLITPMDKPDNRRSSTPTTTEIAYREVPIPPRHLPQGGNTRKLEIWVLEQMRLLEAELGPVILPPPELVGIGEYITGQRLPDEIHPHIKLRYKRTVRSHRPSVEPGKNAEETFSLAELMDEPLATSPVEPSTTPLNLPEPTLPQMTHLEAASSPSAPNSPPPIKLELDEFVDDPPSVPASPSLTHPVIESTLTPKPTTESLDENTTIGAGTTTNKEPARSTSADPNEDSDELQRLRRDLELSKLEAERKHRELEQRILELSQRRSETHTPGPNVEQPLNVRIADEGKPSILPLRRGKYDKTRRLLAVSDSMVLHVSWLGVMQLVDRDSRRIVASGFGSDAPSGASIEDACSLSPSSTALALSGGEPQLVIATLEDGNFGFFSLQDRPHDTKGVCSIVSIDPQSVITLGHDHHYFHWKFQQDQCSTDLLPLPKLHSCTALAFDPLHSNIATAGSESNKRSKLTLHCLADSKQIPNTVELSNHPHHVHIDQDNPFLLILELARLDDQFQVHDIRMPLYQCVQKFGYQNVVHEKAEFRVRGNLKGNYFARGDTGIMRLWDRRSHKSYQTINVIPHQRVVDVVLDHTLISCATEAHHIVTYPIL